jgi:hypothetical protein
MYVQPVWFGSKLCAKLTHARVIYCASAAHPGRTQSGFCDGSGFENTKATSWKCVAACHISMYHARIGQKVRRTPDLDRRVVRRLVKPVREHIVLLCHSLRKQPTL